MKQINRIMAGGFAVAVVAIAVLISYQVAQRPRVTASGATAYDATREIVLKGVVREVSDFKCPEGQGAMGSHLTMDTDQGLMLVHLAPAKLMRDRQIAFAPGDQIEVVGMRVRYFDRHDVLAREVTRGNQSFFVRDREGNFILHQ